jgi:electron transport complex protein RnfG
MKLRLPSAVRSALLLGVVAVLGTALLASVDRLTRDRIVDQQRRAVLRQLNQIIPPALYDNALHDDSIELFEPEFFHHKKPLTVYRARREGQPVAAIFRLVAADGYNGDIELLVGVDHDGVLLGVRITAHRETPGLGDAIELDKNDWVLGFDGRSLGNPPASAWKVRKDGGEFDQFTGATITPRAVVTAVRRSLEFHRLHRDSLFGPAIETVGETP